MLGVDVDGEDELLARLVHARAGILDLTDANRDAVRLVSSGADPTAPRKTGALAAGTITTAGPSGWGLTNATAYAVPVHWGTRHMRARPWLLDAAKAAEGQWMGQLTDHVQRLLD